MSEPIHTPTPDYNRTDQPKKPVLAIVSLVLGILSLCTCGLTTLPGVVVGLWSIKRNGRHILSILGVTFSLILGIPSCLWISSGILFPESHKRGMANMHLNNGGMPDLPSNATDV